MCGSKGLENVLSAGRRRGAGKDGMTVGEGRREGVKKERWSCCLG